MVLENLKRNVKSLALRTSQTEASKRSQKGSQEKVGQARVGGYEKQVLHSMLAEPF